MKINNIKKDNIEGSSFKLLLEGSIVNLLLEIIRIKTIKHNTINLQKIVYLLSIKWLVIIELE